MKSRIALAGVAAFAAVLVAPGVAGATTGTFTAAGPNAIPASGSAGTYPWNVVVSGLPGNTTDVNVTLNGVSHTRVSDLDALLVAPNGGGNSLFMSDIGDDTDVAGANLTFDDSAGANAPVGAALTAGTYRPTNGDGADPDAFAATAPAGPFGATLASATNGNPNGTWSVYLTDDDGAGADAGTGTIGSLSLTVTTNAEGTPPAGAGPKPKDTKVKSAKKPKKAKKCKPKRGKGTVGKAPKKCKPKKGRPHREKPAKPEKPSKAEKANASRECRAEREQIGVEAFNEKYGSNENKRNAFGKCVSSKVKEDAPAA